MSEKDSPQYVIDAYRKRQQKARRAPVIGIAVAFVVIGVAFILFWLLGSGAPAIKLSFLATDTPTPSNTPTATNTATITPTASNTPTEEPTATDTVSPTPSGPFIYQVEEGDNLWLIAEKFKVDLLVLITINNLDPTNPTIRVGDKLTIPGPDTQLPTGTPLPSNIPRGTKIQYQVQLGDSVGSIALKFNSTVDAIKTENKIENENEIFVGQILTVPVNLVTPVPTETPTLTLASDAATGTAAATTPTP
jgi:LysM repeat protein